jgi:hypothetical protein
LRKLGLTSGSALTAHPEWKPPPNNQPTLFYLWDFVMRSKYMLSEYDAIKAGGPLKHPRQFTGPVGTLSISVQICCVESDFLKAREKRQLSRFFKMFAVVLL